MRGHPIWLAIWAFGAWAAPLFGQMSDMGFGWGVGVTFGLLFGYLHGIGAFGGQCHGR